MRSLRHAGAVVFASLALTAIGSSSASAETVSFAATGGEQQFAVPPGVTSVAVTATGGKGGTGGGAGGFGATVAATLAVTPGEILYVEVGDNGRGAPSSTSAVFNGGGVGASYAGDASGSGGGASDVRSCARAVVWCALGSAADPRLIVAAGGGGGGSSHGGFAGGAGGAAGAPAATGGAGTASPNGSGGGGGLAATLLAAGTGGAIGSGNNPAALAGGDGSAGQGGAGRTPETSNSPGGGGGGGYFGGGGGGGGSRDTQGQDAGGGGGGAGSSFISLQATAGSIATDSTGVPGVSLAYTAHAAAAAVGPSALTFAGQTASTLSPPQTVTVTDAGTAPLVVSGLSFAGADPGDFLVAGDDCRGTLQPGASCHASIAFAPQGAGARGASLVVSSNDPNGPATVGLAGTGTALLASSPGPTGATGPQGTPGATGPQGPAGKIELVTCKAVTTTVKRNGRKVHVKRQKCTGKLVSGSFKLTAAAVSVSVTRAGVRYATGRLTGGSRLVLTPTRKLTPGSYTLTLRVRGGSLRAPIVLTG